MRLTACAVLLLVGAAGPFFGCGGSRETSDAPEPVTPEEAERVLERHRDAWMAMPEVQGAGLGRCDAEPCVVIYVAGDTAAVREEIPERVEGVFVRLEPTGRFRAQEPPDTGPS